MCNFMEETIFVKMRTKNIGLFAFVQSDKNRWQLNYDFLGAHFFSPHDFSAFSRILKLSFDIYVCK